MSEDSVFYLGALGLVWLIESALRLLLRLRLRRTANPDDPNSIIGREVCPIGLSVCKV